MDAFKGNNGVMQTSLAVLAQPRPACSGEGMLLSQQQQEQQHPNAWSGVQHGVHCDQAFHGSTYSSR